MRRLIIIAVVTYVACCVVAGIGLAELTVHVPHIRVEHGAAFARYVHDRFGGVLDNVVVRAADGAELRAWYVKPSHENGHAVLLLHGVGDNREGMAGHAELLLAHGYRVLLPDSRQHGESGGALTTYGLLEADDVRRWVTLLYDRGAHCVYGLGESMGAAILLQSLRVEPRFCAVAAESAFANFREVAYDRAGLYVGAGAWLGRTLGRPAIEAALLYTRLRYRLNLAQANPEDAVRATPVPLLLIHGDADSNILPRHSRRLAAANRAAQLWIVPRAMHTGAYATAPLELETRLLQLFNQQVPRPASAAAR